MLKFGGASVATPEHIRRAAARIASLGERLVVVVSAMGNSTTELIRLAHRVHNAPPERELDMLVSTGERVSMALLAMALEGQGIQAVSFTGSQSGILTSGDHLNARIVDVRPHRVLTALASGKVAIVAGFQGVSMAGEITTLGRGGSDTTAVALAVALQAAGVTFFKDVPGVFDRDPKGREPARQFENLTYDEAVALTSQGAQILHPRCVLLARANGVPLHVGHFAAGAPGSGGTSIGPREAGTFPGLYEGLSETDS